MTKRKMLAITIALVIFIFFLAYLVEDKSNTDITFETTMQSETNIQSQGDIKPETTVKTAQTTSLFKVIAKKRLAFYLHQTIMYDPDTMVMYTYLDGYRAGKISEIYNPDGTLKLYSKENTNETFVIVANRRLTIGVRQIIMYDPDTMVMYTWLNETMCPMYNSDGTLKLYSPEG